MKYIYAAAFGAAITSSQLVFAQNIAEKQEVNRGNERSSQIEETIVTGFRKAGFTEITEDAEKLMNIPGALGDPIGAITALPGVISPVGGGEPAVRGSAPEDNRYYIDGMPAGYIFHEFNTSIFDENVVQDFQLFSAGFGAQYSEATGAVFDIRLRDPSNIDFTSKLNISMLRAGIFIESGLTDNTAFYLSARQGLIHLFVSEEDEADDDGMRLITAPKDSDYQFKGSWDVSGSHGVTLSLAGASDFAEAEFGEFSDDVQKNPDFSGKATVDRKFDSQGINYRYLSDDYVESNLTIARYTDSQLVEWGNNYFLELELENILARGHYSRSVGAHTFSIGGEYSDKTYDYTARLIQFVCTDFDVDCQDRRGLIDETEEASVAETNIYITDNWQVTEDILVEAGMQRSGNNYTDEYFVNPKISMSWKISDVITLMSSAGKYNRTPNIDTILSSVGNPHLKSPRASHLTFGMKGRTNTSWTWTIEGYYKKLTELPLALDESQPDVDLYYSNDVEGRIHGLEFMLNKDLVGKWFGWASLSLAKSERTNLRTDETREYTLDTPVVFNFVANYEVNHHWTTGVRFTLKNGEASTEITGIQANSDFPDHYLPVYGEAYTDRLPFYSRLDFRAEREFSFYGNDANFYIDILNLLNRENVVSEDLDYERVNETGELYLKESVDMGIFPSIGFLITF